jgi:hypothetical protein
MAQLVRGRRGSWVLGCTTPYVPQETSVFPQVRLRVHGGEVLKIFLEGFVAYWAPPNKQTPLGALFSVVVTSSRFSLGSARRSKSLKVGGPSRTPCLVTQPILFLIPLRRLAFCD